jgi:valyl-tRNA synthetase
VPFKKVYIHALVRDSKGQKMSKSKGNVIDPLDLIEKYGADALRFTMTAMAAQGRDIRLSEDRVEGYRNFATKLWNATRYCEMNGCLPPDSFDPKSVQHPVNQWVLRAVAQCSADIERSLAEYKFNEAAGAIYQFVWGSFCDWYLEFTKPLLNGDDVSLKAEIRATTGWVLDQILILLNPFMPFVTEEIYATITTRVPGTRLISSRWPDYAAIPDAVPAMRDIAWVQGVISDIRSVRADMNVPAGAKIDLLVKDASPETADRLKRYEMILKQMARLSSIGQTDTPPKQAIKSVIHEATFILPIAELIDLDKERARLTKQIDKLKQDIGKIDQKLDNQEFVANAPEDIIAEQKSRRSEAQGLIAKLSAALDQLAA